VELHLRNIVDWWKKIKVQSASVDKRLQENPIKGYRIVDKDAGNIEERGHRSPVG